MIISPPFLPIRDPNESDEEFVTRAMPGGQAGEGGYPVSLDMNWHGGVHLTAPLDRENCALPVRAIADGTVAFLRSPTPQNSDMTHPLNYRGAWTDDGCVVIRHKTDIGADADTDQTTSVVFFSVYMHLQTVSNELRQNQQVYRKEVLGTAGHVYGVGDTIHFEIICDDTNVEHLTGRSDTYNSECADGRTDAIFGALHFFLPAGTSFPGSCPDLRAFLPVRVASDPQAAPVPGPFVYTSTEGLFLVMSFVKGDCIMQTRHLDGTPGGLPLTEAEYEYKLYRKATTDYPQSPSAGYELLRFGRVVGPDALSPANAPHWRQVIHPDGIGWVDLNDPNVKRFSDADFPFWDNWRLVDGSSSTDSRCRDVGVLELLDVDNNLNGTPQETQQALRDPAVQTRLSHTICKFQTEWDSTSIIDRFRWLGHDPLNRMDVEAFERFRAHVAALCFWEQANVGIDRLHWHFHPKQFIVHLRKCGWLSQTELCQMLPRSAGQWNTNAHPHVWQFSNISWAAANARFGPYVAELNRTFRKYNLLDAKRQIHFLAQTFIETALWAISSGAVSAADRTMREIGKAHPKIVNGVITWPTPMMEFYTVFYGRGIMQLTWPFNYADYGSYRSFVNVSQGYIYGDTRLTHTSTHYWSGHPSPQNVWFPRYDPEHVADDPFNACDSGGFYWVSKNTGGGRININRVADRTFSTDAVGRCSVLVNGGGYGYRERQSYAAFLKRYRDDDTDTALTSTFQVTYGGQNMEIQVHFNAQRP